MNSTSNNDEQIQKLERLEKVYEDDRGQKESTIDKATEEMPFAFGRKCANILFGAVFVFSAIALFSGALEIPMIVTMLLFSLGLVVAAQIPVFIHKEKHADTVIAVIVAVLLVFLAIYMLTVGDPTHTA